MPLLSMRHFSLLSTVPLVLEKDRQAGRKVQRQDINGRRGSDRTREEVAYSMAEYGRYEVVV